MTRYDCQEIMNIVLKDGLSVKEKYRREVRKEIFLLSKMQVQNSNGYQKQVRSIKGKINSYVAQVNWKQAKALRDYAKKLGVPL